MSNYYIYCTEATETLFVNEREVAALIKMCPYSEFNINTHPTKAIVVILLHSISFTVARDVERVLEEFKSTYNIKIPRSNIYCSGSLKKFFSETKNAITLGLEKWVELFLQYDKILYVYYDKR